MSSPALSKARLGRMHDVMAGYVERGAVPGLVTLVSRRGEVNKGKHGTVRILSRPSIELMTADHLTPAQKADAGVFLGDSRGWGLGVAMVTRRDDVRAPWEGSAGTGGWAQAAWTSPSPPGVYLDFWTSAYQAIDD